MPHDHLIEEAHKLLHATPSASALDELVRHIAIGWCVSFGVKDEAAYTRLAHATLKRMTAPNTSYQVLDLNHFIDMHAEAVILAWFTKLQPFLMSAEIQPLSMLRYAFLQANAQGDFSDVFLLSAAPFEDIGTAMAVHDVSPTPVMTRRDMPRQKI